MNTALRSLPKKKALAVESSILRQVNPPFNYHPWGRDNLLKDKRWKYGIPPAGNANFAWIQQKQKGKTLFIDARKMGHMVDRKHRDFSDEDIEKLADTFTAFQNGTLEDVKGFCAVADLPAIEKQNFILTPGRYVGVEEQEEEIRKKLGVIGYKI